MADISITTSDWTAPHQASHAQSAPGRLNRRVQVLRRRARRDRYVAHLIATVGIERAADLGIDTRPRRYPWFDTMFRAMGGR